MNRFMIAVLSSGFLLSSLGAKEGPSPVQKPVADAFEKVATQESVTLRLASSKRRAPSRSAANIDILFVYTQQALDQANADGGTIAASAAHACERANAIYLRNEINAILRVAHVAKISYVETEIGRALEDLKGRSDGKMDEVHALRVQYKADVVCLVMSSNPEVSQAAGIAYYSVVNGKEHPELALTVCRRYGENVNALWHEMAHIMGCKHLASEPGVGAYPFSNGYQFSVSGDRYVTLLANGYAGRTIEYFSNPNRLYLGVPAGDPDTADNVRTMNLTAPRIASYDGQLTGANKPPTANAQKLSTIENTPLSITLTGSDPEGAPLTFAPTSDPSNGFLSDLNVLTGVVTYTPAAGFTGTDAFTFAVSDGTETSPAATVRITVAASSGGGGESDSDIDSDADGIPDELETALNSDPNDASSTPAGISPGTPDALALTKLQIRLNFANSETDGLVVLGTLPIPEGFTVEGQAVTVDIGGVIRTFELDARGKSRSRTEQFKIRIKTRRRVATAQDARFWLRVKRSSFADLLEDEGLTGVADVSGEQRIVPVIVLFNGRSYRTDATVVYRARSNKKGSAKF